MANSYYFFKKECCANQCKKLKMTGSLTGDYFLAAFTVFTRSTIRINRAKEPRMAGIR